MFSHEYNLPVFIGTGAVKTSGDTSELAPGQLMLANAKTYEAVVGSIPTNQAVLVAGGSWHTKDKLNKFVGGLKESDKTIEFLGKDVLEFQRSKPRKAESEQWVIGWDGVDPKKTLSFQAGESYFFKVKVWGEDVYGTFLRPVDRFIEIKADCATTGECVDGCEDGVACKTYAKRLADAINNDPELKYFLEAETISSDMVAADPTHSLYCLSVCDTGDMQALAAVQTQYPTYGVERVGRDGSTSTYQVCLPLVETAAVLGTVTTAGSSPNITVSSVAITSGGEGYLSNPTITFTGGTGTAATAHGVVTNGVITSIVIDTPGAYSVAPTAAVVSGGAVPVAFTPVIPVALAECGTCAAGYTLVEAKDVYMVQRVLAPDTDINSPEDKQALATAVATAYDNSAPVGAGRFLSQVNGVANIEITVTAGLTLTPVNSDQVTLVRSIGETCVPGAATSIAWTACGERYKTTKKLTLTLEKECDGQNRLADLQAFYANDSKIVAGSLIVKTAGTCSDVYEVDIYNDECLIDGCLSEDVPTFTTLQSFEGFVWEDAFVEPDTDLSVLCGVRITAAYEDTKFGGCSFSPLDYYSVRPLKLEITQWDDSGLPCATPVPSRKIRNSSMATQSGDWVIRELIKANRYKAYGQFFHDVRLREVLDANTHEIVDRDKSYLTYHLKVRQNRLWQNHNADFSPEIYEFLFAFPVGVDTTAFENVIGNFTSQFGVYLQDR